MSDENSVTIHATFASPENAFPAANELASQGWDVRLHVVLEASATGSPEFLQGLHDHLRERAASLGLGGSQEQWPRWENGG